MVHAPEFLVPFDAVTQVAEANDLHLISAENLGSFAATHCASDDYADLLDAMGVTKLRAVSPEEWQVVSLYQFAIFEKR